MMGAHLQRGEVVDEVPIDRPQGRRAIEVPVHVLKKGLWVFDGFIEIGRAHV